MIQLDALSIIAAAAFALIFDTLLSYAMSFSFHTPLCRPSFSMITPIIFAIAADIDTDDISG
jgi:hypothetical protein